MIMGTQTHNRVRNKVPESRLWGHRGQAGPQLEKSEKISQGLMSLSQAFEGKGQRNPRSRDDEEYQCLNGWA